MERKKLPIKRKTLAIISESTWTAILNNFTANRSALSKRVIPIKRKVLKPGVQVLLDSGAYSAWRQESEVDLDAYIQFIKDNQALIHSYVNLDVIPARWGKAPTAQEVEESAQQGWKNMEYMEAQGLKPIPVFHQGERFYWLERMMATHDYIGIAPSKDFGANLKKVWLDRVFDFITDDKGYPKIKTHGFGVTAVPLIFRYPWYSIDSLSWLLLAAYGKVLIPPPKAGGGFDFCVSPKHIYISNKAPHLDNTIGINAWGSATKCHIIRYLEYMGIKYEEGLILDGPTRHGLNAKYFLEVERQLNNERFLYKSKSLY
jgi:hypothetical protein